MSRESEVLKRLTEMNRQLAAGFAKLGATCEGASESLRQLGEAGIHLDELRVVSAWHRFSFENKRKALLESRGKL